MPEGPEVKVITQQLAKQIEGKLLIAFWPLGGRFQNNPPEGSKEIELPATIEKVDCKGKFIYWKLSNGWFLWNTLGMTGEWALEKSKHSGMVFVIGEIVSTLLNLQEGHIDTNIYFDDIRHFGTIKFVKGEDQLNKKLASIGPDMLSNPIDLPGFKKILQKHKNKTITEVLMNQKNISGVGNYVKAEALYRAEISPWRKCGLLTGPEMAKIRDSIIAVLSESFKAQGATLSTYKRTDQDKGSFAQQLRVYNKQQDPLGNKVISEETPDKRTSWWVPSIQT